MDITKLIIFVIISFCLIFLAGCGNGRINSSGMVINASGLPKNEESNFNYRYIGEEREYTVSQKTGIPGVGFTKEGWYGYDFEIINIKERKALKITVGKERYNHGYVKYARIYDVFENNLSWPKKKHKRFKDNVVVENVDSHLTKKIVPVEYLNTSVSIDSLSFSGETTPNSNGEILIDLLEPSLFATNRGFVIAIHSSMYKINKAKDTQNVVSVSSSFHVHKNDVDEMVGTFKGMKVNSILQEIYRKDTYQALIDSKYIYDRYGELQIAKKFYESTYYKNSAGKSGKFKRAPLRVPLRLPHPASLILGLLVDVILSSGAESNIKFLH
jgi:hypothetical protein